MNITSTAFTQGNKIPVKYTCDGENISPPLNWEDIPETAISLALICEDPDAPSKIWTHWVIFNIPPDIKGFNEAVETKPILHSQIIQGLNDSGNYGYTGPCPPDREHRYFLYIYALDNKLEFNLDSINKGISKKMLLDAMEGHIIEKSQLMGLYDR